MSGSVTNPAATRADSRSTTDSVMAKNGGTTYSMSTHHAGVGKNQPPTCGPHDEVHRQRVQTKPTGVVTYSGNRLAMSLPR